MWYQAPDEEADSAGVITLGPISFSMSTLYASVMSSLVVIPPIVLITFFFAKSGPKLQKKKHGIDNLIIGYETYYYNKNKTRKESEPEKTHDDITKKIQENEKNNAKKRKKQLPWWCIIVSWILIFLAVAGSAFFTILYSFTWGGEKSTGWLVTFFLSFFESVILVQPFKVGLYNVQPCYMILNIACYCNICCYY